MIKVVNFFPPKNVVFYITPLTIAFLAFPPFQSIFPTLRVAQGTSTRRGGHQPAPSYFGFLFDAMRRGTPSSSRSCHLNLTGRAGIPVVFSFSFCSDGSFSFGHDREGP